MGKGKQRELIGDLYDLREKLEKQMDDLNEELEKTREGKGTYKAEHLERQRKDVKRKLKGISAMLKKTQSAKYFIHTDDQMYKSKEIPAGKQGGGTKKRSR